MVLKVSLSVRLLGALLSGLGAFPFHQAAAAIPDYIRAVEADMAEFSTGSFELDPGSPWISGGETPAGDAADPRQLAGFETFLKRQFPGTFLQYRSLSDAKKQQIYQEYVNTGDLGKTRTAILRTLSEERSGSSASSFGNLPR